MPRGVKEEGSFQIHCSTRSGSGSACMDYSGNIFFPGVTNRQLTLTPHTPALFPLDQKEPIQKKKDGPRMAPGYHCPGTHDHRTHRPTAGYGGRYGPLCGRMIRHFPFLYACSTCSLVLPLLHRKNFEFSVRRGFTSTRYQQLLSNAMPRT